MKRLLPGDKKTKSGQAVLVVLLMVTVVLTIGLSSVSRSITDIKTSQHSEESTRVFWVAQGNLEKAIIANSSIPSETADNITSLVSVSSGGEGVKQYIFDDSMNSFGRIGRDEYKTFWLVGHDPNGNINTGNSYLGSFVDVYFPSGAIEAILVYFDGATFKYNRYAFDHDPAGHHSNFSPVSTGVFPGNSSLTRYGRIDFPTGPGIIPYLIIIKSYFMENGEKMVLGFNGDQINNFVSQGNCFSSTAVFDVSNIKRNLQECRTHTLPPLIFSNVLFSGGGISK